MTCITAPGTGAGLVWRVTIASQTSPAWNGTAYAAPSISYFEGPGSSNADTAGWCPFILFLGLAACHCFVSVLCYMDAETFKHTKSRECLRFKEPALLRVSHSGKIVLGGLHFTAVPVLFAHTGVHRSKIT
jgi:hypothetical protein